MLREMLMEKIPFLQRTTASYSSGNPDNGSFRAIILTLLLSFSATGCAFIHERIGEHCKSRAYTKTILADYITTRYVSGSPVRMAVIPFSVPANISYRDTERPGWGSMLAWSVQAEMLRTGIVPIVEVLNREDWPGKKEEFHTGNFGAIEMARDAGYDLVLVGYISPPRSQERITASVKIIDVDSGITVWYGDVQAVTWEKDMDWVSSTLMIDDRTPSRKYSNAMFDELSRCIAAEASREDIVVPE